jgi:hypothetical protein
MFLKSGNPVVSEVASVFFCDEKNSNPNSNEILKIFKYSLRQVVPWPIPKRSKPVVICPNCVKDLGLHCPFDPPYNSSLVLHENETFLFHYRNCKDILNSRNYKKFDKGFMIDESMKRFEQDIMQFINYYLMKTSGQKLIE